MKQNRILAWVLILCLCLAGCGSSKTDPTETTGHTLPSHTRNYGDLGIDVPFQLAGSRTVTYTVNTSKARYVTSAADLPDHEELSQYDDAWFEDHALLLIYESVASGSVQVGIESIQIEEGTANITLTHEPTGELGTTVMTTWLLWAEVDQGLQYTWTVVNPALENNTSAY